MTPAEGYAITGYQRPGVRIVIGPEGAREERIKPLSPLALYRLPGDATWWAYDWRRRIGFAPSLWASSFAFAAIICGHFPTDDEMRWLNGPATLEGAREWLRKIKEAATATSN